MIINPFRFFAVSALSKANGEYYGDDIKKLSPTMEHRRKNGSSRLSSGWSLIYYFHVVTDAFR
ncbi:hypothetical protein GCM10011328_19090 [Hafnia psychrotolerans]|uniref:Uncharacterized protein n=1 Tax=Hafnia psychrotolerans TaxID=1477018 RepID=A0ABQ1GHY0_9GAMM|nr:hypothetical protein GCM10011328_19090 [Hafnia psychrotolerans]